MRIAQARAQIVTARLRASVFVHDTPQGPGGIARVAWSATIASRERLGSVAIR